MATGSFVVVSKAADMDYTKDFVSLPRSYPTRAYYDRADVQSIIEVVNRNLAELDGRTGFTGMIKNMQVVIKPNQVFVCHNVGFEKPDYPNTTDPRVLDAVVLFLKQYTSDIVIAESSGRGMPTRGSFKLSGIDRLVRHHGIELLWLEEQPVDRYILPRAVVMKEIIVPRIFTEVAEGRAFYISMPKMKTNLYTEVTLGFKNGMGCMSYNLRQRNHNFDIDQKLVDMLYLFKPNLVIIDGIVGAEGQCPAPVDPVASRVIISGNNSVETDKVAAAMMGFNPEEVKLMKIATQMGFGDASVQVIGQQDALSFRKADPSLLNDAFKELYPNVRVLIGHQLPDSPIIQDIHSVTRETMLAMELNCRGGCLATTRLGFEYLKYEGSNRTFRLVVILGCGVDINGDTWYFDRDGRPYSLSDISSMTDKKLAVGSCSRIVKDIVDTHLDGCMVPPNDPHMAIHKLSGRKCRVVNALTNPSFFTLSIATLRRNFARVHQLRMGNYLDCEMNRQSPCSLPDVSARVLTGEELTADYIKYDFPPMTQEEKRRLIKNEWEEMLFTFL